MSQSPKSIGMGRKPISKSGEKMKVRAVRMTDEEWAKCLELGGSSWIRKCVKKERLLVGLK
jgi:hypothetical protein